MHEPAAGGDENFKLGIGYFSQGDIGRAIPALESAATAGHAEAQNLLGLIYFNGMGIPCQHGLALELFRDAAAAGSREAAFNLSAVLFNGFAGTCEIDAALQALVTAAQLDHRAALRVLGLVYLATGVRAPAGMAARCFRRAALLGDVYAMYFAARNALADPAGATANSDAAYWLTLAAREGLPFAVEKLAALDVKIDPVKADMFAARQRSEAALSSAPELGTLPLPAVVEAGSRAAPQRDGAVLQREQAVSQDLCEYLVHIAFRKLKPSSVIDPHTGEGRRTVLRTSYSMNLLPSMYDVAVGILCSNMASLVGVPFAQAEPLVVLKYLPGQEYKPHFDFVPNTDTRGQRIATALLYLNEPLGGGETDFPRLGVRVPPQRGKAIGFYNCDVNGAPDPRTLHAGLPVTQGEKWLATLWFRERVYDWST